MKKSIWVLKQTAENQKSSTEPQVLIKVLRCRNKIQYNIIDIALFIYGVPDEKTPGW